MSKFLPDPQIQSLRAMRAGDIAIGLPTPVTQEVGVVATAALSPEALESVVLVAVNAIEPLSGNPSESPTIGVVDVTAVSENAVESVSMGTTNALETLAGIPTEAPVIGVGFITSVV